MEPLKDYNAVLDYIEQHLTGDIDEQAMARIAGLGAGLYPRVFAALTGQPLSLYIRQRRLTQAAQDLARRGDKVIDVALRYGYESADAFAAAFRRLHGITPTQARQPGAALKSYPKLSFTLSIQGGIPMDYRKEILPELYFTGRSFLNSMEHNGIPAFWGQIMTDGTAEQLFTLGACPHNLGLVGICCSSAEGESDRFRYMAGWETQGQRTLPGMEVFTVPASTWLVFPCTGPMPGAIQDVWKRIYGEFFQDSPYRRADTPDMEVYAPGDNSAPDYSSEIWVPVIEE